MAKGRMLAATIVDDRRLNELSTESALVYLMTIPQLDRDGLILGEPNALWGQVCRRRPELIQRMPDIIATWLRSGLVNSYETKDGDTILHFIGFQKNQTMTHYDRETASRFPCPPGFTRGPRGPVPDTVQQSGEQPQDELRTNSGPTPDELRTNRREENRIEEEEKGNATAQPEALTVNGASRRHPETDKDFGELCKQYEQEFGMLSPHIADELSALLDEYKSKQMIVDAFSVAVEANKRKMSYVKGTLKNWRSEGKHGKAQAPTPKTTLVMGKVLDNPFTIH